MSEGQDPTQPSGFAPTQPISNSNDKPPPLCMPTFIMDDVPSTLPFQASAAFAEPKAPLAIPAQTGFQPTQVMPTTTFAPTQMMNDTPEQQALQPTQIVQEEMAPTQLITATEDDQPSNPEPLPSIENVEGIRDISAPITLSQDKDDLLGMLGSQDQENQNEQQCDVEEDEKELEKDDEPEAQEEEDQEEQKQEAQPQDQSEAQQEESEKDPEDEQQTSEPIQQSDDAQQDMDVEEAEEAPEEADESDYDPTEDNEKEAVQEEIKESQQVEEDKQDESVKMEIEPEQEEAEIGEEPDEAMDIEPEQLAEAKSDEPEQNTKSEPKGEAESEKKTVKSKAAPKKTAERGRKLPWQPKEKKEPKPSRSTSRKTAKQTKVEKKEKTEKQPQTEEAKEEPKAPAKASVKKPSKSPAKKPAKTPSKKSVKAPSKSSSKSAAKETKKPAAKKTTKSPSKKSRASTPAPKKSRKVEGPDGEVKKVVVEPTPEFKPATERIAILFQQVLAKKRQSYERALRKMNVNVVYDFDQNPTHFVMPKYVRTMKLITAVNLGCNIVSLDWVENSIENKEMLPIKNYSVADQVSNNISAISARGDKMLQDMSVYITSSVNPSAKEWKEAIQAAGGVLLNKRPRALNHTTIIIAKDDKSDARERELFNTMGFRVHDTEYLLTGLLTHNFPSDRTIQFQIFMNHS